MSNATDFTATWRVPYEAGELKAIRYELRGGQLVMHPPPPPPPPMPKQSPPAAAPPAVTAASDAKWLFLGEASHRESVKEATKEAVEPPPPAGSDSIAFTTAGPPARIMLTTDRAQLRASRDDLAYVVATAVDAHGRRVQCGALAAERSSSFAARAARLKAPFDADGRLNWARPQRIAPSDGDEPGARIAPPSWCSPVEITFEVSGGAAALEAVGSGDPLDTSSFAGPTRRTYRGRALAIVRPSGAAAARATTMNVTVRASAPGLAGASLDLEVAHAVEEAGCA